MLIKDPTKNPQNVWRNHNKGSTIGQINKQNLERLFCDEYDGFIPTDPVDKKTKKALPPN